MMLGNSLKLMGLASMNIFIALALSAAYLSHGGGRVQMLTEDNVTAFIRDVSDITAGRRTAMDAYAVTAYFMQHVADDGAFKSNIRSSIPGMAERDVTMDKKAFISDVLQDMRQRGQHDATIKIEDIRITDNGRTATAITTSDESGAVQVTSPDSNDTSMVPVKAVSYCEQTISLADNHVIQMKEATCTTDVALAESF
jgi:hypothetical protein